jgi:hypothetical protein
VHPHDELFPNVDIVTLRKQFNYTTFPSLKWQYKERIASLARVREIDLTLEALRNHGRKNVSPYIRTESGIASSEMTDGLVTDMEKEENLTDVVGDSQITADYGKTKYSEQGIKTVLHMDSFFSRPIQIAEGSFDTDAFTNLTLDVWDLYTLDPSVRAKLRNYTYLKGDLKIRIVISGTPFHYGKFLVSYQPYAQRNANLTYLETILALEADCLHMVLNYLSQSEGSLTMDIRENKPLELTCPFISTKNAHRLYNTAATALGDTTSYEDLSEAGSLYMYTINAPKCINADADPVRYYLYAWMDNVELGPPTGTQVVIRTESKIDERNKGPVEKFGSGAKTFSKSLQKVPYIGKIATASTMAFGALESVAALFGWSKPILIDAPVYVKNLAYQNGAHTLGFETVSKLTLDPKQELTVDPSVTGGTSDEMSFAHILNISSFLTAFEWAPDDAAMTPMWRCAITPLLCSGTLVVDKYVLQPTTMAFVAMPFYSWRGDVEYTFEVVCSQFHRGKFAVFYEPNVEQNVLIDANLNLNRQFMKIIDIQETQTITLRVNWAHYRSWAKCTKVDSASTVPYTSSIIPFAMPPSEEVNGYICVVPITELVSPDNNPITLNVYVKCPNLKVNRLTAANFPKSREVPVEAFAESKIDSFAMSSQPVSIMDLNEAKSDDSVISLEHYGEEPASFRALLKRYVTYYNETDVISVARVINELELNDSCMPEINLPYGATTNISCDLYSYLRYAYLGIRGSCRKRVRFVNSFPYIDHAQVRISNYVDSTTGTIPVFSILALTAGNMQRCAAVSDGSVLIDQSSNGGIELECPFYSRNKFHFSFADDFIGSNPGGDANMDTIWMKRYRVATYAGPTTTSDLWGVSIDIATGEDFCLMRFQGTPSFVSTTVI